MIYFIYFFLSCYNHTLYYVYRAYWKTEINTTYLLTYVIGAVVLVSIAVSIIACHAKDRGSTPRRGASFLRASFFAAKISKFQHPNDFFECHI